MNDLYSRSCAPCKAGAPPLTGDALAALRARLGAGWNVVDEHHLEKEIRFENFRDALDFTVKLGELAEAEGHHPDIFLAWGKVKIKVWTHAAKGLTENDFILAAKADRLGGAGAAFPRGAGRRAE